MATNHEKDEPSLVHFHVATQTRGSASLLHSLSLVLAHPCANKVIKLSPIDLQIPELSLLRDLPGLNTPNEWHLPVLAENGPPLRR